MNRGTLCIALAALAFGCGGGTQPAAGKFRHVMVDRQGPRDPWGKGVGDLNGDGRPDLIVGGRSGGGLVWYENPGWTRHVVSADGAFSTDQESGDLDGDGRVDIISLTYDEVAWFRNGDWHRTDIATAHLHDIEVADLDGDGRLDVVGRGQTAFGNAPPGIHLYFQRDSGWDSRELSAPPGEGLKVTDLDGDSLPDVVIGGEWLQNPGSPTGEWRAFTYAADWHWADAFVATGDLNGDGRMDVVLAPAEKPGTRYRLSWFEAPADRTGAWTEHVVLEDVEAVHHFVGVGDFNQDGVMDIATSTMHQGQPPREVAVYLQAAGSAAWNKLVLSDRGSHNMRVFDADGDGDPDLFGANWEGERQQVELWINRQCTPEQGCASPASPAQGN
jgi:hypothetical protein